MEVTVSGRNMDITEQLRLAATEKIGRLARFVDGMDRAEVHFSEQRNPRIADKEVCEVTMEGHGHHVRAKVSAPDAFVAVDLVVSKLEHQLTKLRSKLTKRSHLRPSPSVDFEEALETEEFVPGLDGDVRIVKTKSFVMKPMTPVEAAMQMDLLGHGFFFFTNAETTRPAVVYQRRDGNVGLIDEAG